MSTPTQIFKPQLNALSHTVGTEAWKRDHRNAMACRGLESVLRLGSCLFELLNRADEEWRLDYAEGRIEKSLEAEFDRLFSWWLKPCKRIDAQIDVFEQLGYEVEGAEAFRKIFRAAKQNASE